MYTLHMHTKETLADYRDEKLNLRITCRWCGTIRLMPINDAMKQPEINVAEGLPCERIC